MSGCRAAPAALALEELTRHAAPTQARAPARPPAAAGTSRRRTDNDIKIFNNLEYNRMFYLYTHTTFIPAVVSAALARIPYEIPGRVSCDHADRVSSATDATLTRGASRGGPGSPAVRPAPTAPHTHTATAHTHTCVRTCLYTRRTTSSIYNLDFDTADVGITQLLPKQGLWLRRGRRRIVRCRSCDSVAGAAAESAAGARLQVRALSGHIDRALGRTMPSALWAAAARPPSSFSLPFPAPPWPSPCGPWRRPWTSS